MADFSLEKKLADKYKFIAGVDEAGRGPLAGPVVAATVILDHRDDIFSEINDSKKLSKIKREKLFELIISNAIDYSVYFVDNSTIDEINILRATMLAMSGAIKNMKLKADFLLIDGNYFKPDDEIIKKIPATTIIKGDSDSKSIAAASILAKVTRDRWMETVAHQEFPQYNFSKHKGYATKEHIELIKKHGVCKYHRRSFLKNILRPSNNLFE